MNRETLETLRGLAIRAAEAPSDLILGHFSRADMSVENKQDGSLVTEVDRRAEAIMREVLRAAPEAAGFAVTGEEMGADSGDHDYRWLIDPIDGTTSFSRGIPTFGTLLSLVDEASGRPLLGVIHLPAFNETYVAARGLGTTCNGKPIRASAATDLASAIVSVSELYQFRDAGCEAAYHRLREACPNLRGYTDCFAHALTVRGGIDATFEPWMNPWDIAATQVLVEEAGGICLLRSSRRQPNDDRTALDAIFGSARVVETIARLVGF